MYDDDLMLEPTEPQEQFTPPFTNWQDQVDTRNGAPRYIETENPDGSITHEPVPLEDEEVVQWGTPQSAKNFNQLEQSSLSGRLLGAELARHVLAHQRVLNRLESEAGETELTNNQEYPFNNSLTTVALSQPMDTTEYTVQADILSSQGNVGRVVITDKQKNGFKMAYTGSATNVVIRWAVKGGKF